MEIENAIKKLSKYGKVQENGVEYWVERGNYIVGFLPNPHPHGTTITYIYARENCYPSQYNYYDNLTQAIDFVLKREQKEQEEEDMPCMRCGRRDLPLHFNYQCPECFTPPEKAGTYNDNQVT